MAALAAVQKVGKRGEAEREPVSASRPTGAQVGWYDEASAEAAALGLVAGAQPAVADVCGAAQAAWPEVG